MNALTNTEHAAVVEAQHPIVVRRSAAELMQDSATMDRMMRMAQIMASGVSTVPKHLQKNEGDCFAVVIQAHVWGMIPHIVAQKTHLVNGTLGYEAQLVMAVVQASGEITGRFHVEYEGKSPNLLCRVGAVIKGETEITWGPWLSESSVTTKNSPLWKTNPAQQLFYLQGKNWSRMYTPGAILGIYTPDELESYRPPVDMGMVQPGGDSGQPAVDADALLREGWAAADKGMVAFGPWFNGLPKSADGPHRSIVAPHRDAMLAKAKEIDAARTVDAEPKATAAAHQSGGSPIDPPTPADVLKRINDAKTLDALMVAADWINAITDTAEADKLTARYMERSAEFGQ